jgi:hypothetical protein
LNIFWLSRSLPRSNFSLLWNEDAHFLFKDSSWPRRYRRNNVWTVDSKFQLKNTADIYISTLGILANISFGLLIFTKFTIGQIQMDTLNKIGFTINLLVDQLGTALFIPMVYVIVKYKSVALIIFGFFNLVKFRKLHDSPCLKLIGIFMFACLCSKFKIIFPYLIRVIPLLNVPLVICFSIQVAPTLIVCNIVPIILSMAFDRCLSVFFPFWSVKWLMLRPLTCKTYVIFKVLQKAKTSLLFRTLCIICGQCILYTKCNVLACFLQSNDVCVTQISVN